MTYADGPDPYAELDTGVAHPARVYDYWLGGTNNFPADREAAERVLAVTPGLRWRVRANRAFLARATRFLAGEAGIGQFLDLGTGIPGTGNTHEVAQQVAPRARVVYVDNDPSTSTRPRRPRSGPTTSGWPRRRRCAPGSRWPGSSPGWTWSSRAWCRSTSGGPIRTTRPRPTRSPRTEQWGASYAIGLSVIAKTRR